MPSLYAEIKPFLSARSTSSALFLFTAEAPAGVGEEKYDSTSASTMALLKHGSGMPFCRLEGLQEKLEIPLPASTQWSIVKAKLLKPALEELIRQAELGEVVYNDDTGMKVLVLDAPDSPERTGVFTSGIISTREGTTDGGAVVHRPPVSVSRNSVSAEQLKSNWLYRMLGVMIALAFAEPPHQTPQPYWQVTGRAVEGEILVGSRSVPRAVVPFWKRRRLFHQQHRLAHQSQLPFLLLLHRR